MYICGYNKMIFYKFVMILLLSSLKLNIYKVTYFALTAIVMLLFEWPVGFPYIKSLAYKQKSDRAAARLRNKGQSRLCARPPNQNQLSWTFLMLSLYTLAG